MLPLKTKLWQGQCWAANLREERRDRRGGAGGGRFRGLPSVPPDSGYWLEVQVLEPRGVHLF